jgi:hypothetical protein
LLWQLLFSFVAAHPHGIAHNSEWTDNGMGTKNHLRSQCPKIVFIHHFSESTKAALKCPPSTISDYPIVTYCEASRAANDMD